MLKYFNNYFENLKTIHQYNTRQKSNKDFFTHTLERNGGGTMQGPKCMEKTSHCNEKSSFFNFKKSYKTNA